jgi:hypothetical protein
MIEVGYNREKAVAYAKKWAFGRNPEFYNFDPLGGDCTNFISQCIYAGCGVMNYTPVMGWYYISPHSRSPSWTGVEYLFNFLTTNNRQGPYGKIAQRSEMEIGDIIQLKNALGVAYHSLIICDISESGEIYVAAHTYDSYHRALSSYHYWQARYIHILGARK